MESSYITSAQKADQLPALEGLPEVAFVGRSNTGKSTLINKILNHQISKTSSTPGRTQMVNFFKVKYKAGVDWVFADLPGYGFNVASREVRQHWDELMSAYLARECLKIVFVLVDVRRDMDIYEWEYLAQIAQDKQAYLILTKSDKLNAKETNQRKAYYAQEFLARNLDKKISVLLVSAMKNKGIEEIRKLIFNH